MAEDFDLSKFITGSLCLKEISTGTVYPRSSKDPLDSFCKEDPLKILGVVPFNERKQVPEDTIGTPIQEFYRGVNVFITGGSGFFGKVLVEKLLRDIPHIGHIYILIREKKGKSCQERFQLLMKDQLFSRLKVEVPHYHTKITPLPGDISKPGLGLSGEDRQMVLDSVHVVFNSAADVRFMEPLRKAIESNVLGSKHVLELAKQMTNLKSFIHVSTAYSQCVHRVLDEAVPKMNINYKEILDYVDSHTDNHIQDNLQRTLQEWPNTYTFSKAVCENMIQEEAGDLPICIIRPSIVSSTYKEPFRGWTDNVNGILGFCVGVSLGILHIMNLEEHEYIDIVPVDYVINCMIAASWSTSKKRGDNYQPYVLNFTLSPKQQTTIRNLIKTYATIDYWPFYQMVWYPSFFLTKSEVLEEMFYLVVQNIHGVIIDTAAVLMGQKPRLRKVNALIYKMKNSLQYFTSNFWEFRNENASQLWLSMTKEDRNTFNFDVSDINTAEYEALTILGVRYFFLKESMESIPAAKRKMKWFYLAHLTLKITFGFFMLKLAVVVARFLPM